MHSQLTQYLSRWQPITPMGLPHRVMADDVYNGMFIPKGAIIFANTRLISCSMEPSMIYLLIANAQEYDMGRGKVS